MRGTSEIVRGEAGSSRADGASRGPTVSPMAYQGPLRTPALGSGQGVAGGLRQAARVGHARALRFFRPENFRGQFCRSLCYKIVMDISENPKVRWLDVVRTVHEGNEVFVLRDPEGITDRSLLVSRDILLLISLMDGTRSAKDIRADCAKVAGLIVDVDRIASVVAALDDCFLLMNRKYEEHIRRLERHTKVSRFVARFCRERAIRTTPLPLRSYLAALMAGETGEAIREERVVGMVAPHIDYARGGDVYAPVYRHLPKRRRYAFCRLRHVPQAHSQDVEHFPERCGDPSGQDQDRGLRRGAVGRDSLLKEYVDEWPHRNEHSIELQLPLMQHLLEGRRFEVLSILRALSMSMWRMDSLSMRVRYRHSSRG